jgi:hypothetical protein
MDNHCSLGFCVEACRAKNATNAHIESGIAVGLFFVYFCVVTGCGAVTVLFYWFVPVS